MSLQGQMWQSVQLWPSVALFERGSEQTNQQQAIFILKPSGHRLLISPASDTHHNYEKFFVLLEVAWWTSEKWETWVIQLPWSASWQRWGGIPRRLLPWVDMKGIIKSTTLSEFLRYCTLHVKIWRLPMSETNEHRLISLHTPVQEVISDRVKYSPLRFSHPSPLKPRPIFILNRRKNTGDHYSLFKSLFLNMNQDIKVSQ